MPYANYTYKCFNSYRLFRINFNNSEEEEKLGLANVFFFLRWNYELKFSVADCLWLEKNIYRIKKIIRPLV